MSTLRATPGQTVGPFFRYGLEFDGGHELVPTGTPGAIRITGRVTDGAGDPVPDALVEIWQADADGTVPAEQGSFHRDGSTFTGFGRAHVGEDGVYEFTTVNPGTPFVSVIVFARGLMDRLHTRLYLPEAVTPAAADDALLSSLTPQERGTLVATRMADGGLHFDIHLQGAGNGDHETVFLDFS